jgi:hypothetical protein
LGRDDISGLFNFNDFRIAFIGHDRVPARFCPVVSYRDSCWMGLRTCTKEAEIIEKVLKTVDRSGRTSWMVARHRANRSSPEPEGESVSGRQFCDSCLEYGALHLQRAIGQVSH